jgi:Carboxypeptidase regulatory-like domain
MCRMSLIPDAPYRYLTQMEERQTEPTELTGSLCCTLLDRRSSVPLHGARITCIGRDNRVSRFDADRFGRFTTTMPQGVYDLVISARGYLSLIVRGVGVLGGHHQIVTRALIPGEGGDSEHEPAAALGGYITDRIGRPVANVAIHIAAEHGEIAYTTRTDRDGAYLLHGIVPQMYDLTVCAMERRLAHELVPVASAKEFVRLDLRVVQI